MDELPTTMLPWLAQVLLAIRDEADLSTRAMAKVAGIEHSALNRIERGENWPRHPDQCVAAYARIASVPPAAVWQRAIALWSQALNDPEAVRLADRLAQDLPRG